MRTQKGQMNDEKGKANKKGTQLPMKEEPGEEGQPMGQNSL